MKRLKHDAERYFAKKCPQKQKSVRFSIFVVTEIICCASVKENAPTEMKTATVKEMFSALFRNDQAMVVVATIVLINSALYLTSNFIIYFFKYDFGGEGWKGSYTLFSTVGGAAQILGMMVLYPLLRKKLSSTGVFRLSLIAALAGYGLLLVFCLTGLSGNLVALKSATNTTENNL